MSGTERVRCKVCKVNTTTHHSDVCLECRKVIDKCATPGCERKASRGYKFCYNCRYDTKGNTRVSLREARQMLFEG